MDVSSLQYRLTDVERKTFEENGVLQIEDGISPEQVATLEGAADKINQRQLDSGAAEPGKAMFFPNFIPEDPAFVELVDLSLIHI